MDNRTVACLRFTEAKKSPQSQKSCKNAQIFVFAIENRRNEQTPQSIGPWRATTTQRYAAGGRHQVRGRAALGRVQAALGLRAGSVDP